MEVTAVLNLLTHANQLKRTPRTGWVQRGVPNAESVADHSFGVVFTVLILAEHIEQTFNREKLLIMAALHDLPEGLTTDIPSPAWRYLPSGVKTNVERGAMNEILEDVPFAADLMAVWEELHTGQTPEALLVHDADKLEMFVQALMYELQTNNHQLQEFWKDPHRFFFPEVQAVYDELCKQRP